MKNKVLFSALLFVTVIVLAFTGCAKPAEEPVSSPAGTAAPTSQPSPAEIEPVELKLANHVPPTHYMNVINLEWAEKIEESTQGAVTMKLYPSATLGNAMDEWNMLKTGVSDIGFIIAPVYAGIFPLSDVVNMPMLMIGDRQYSSDIACTLFDKYICDEFNEVKVLFPGLLGSLQLHTTSKAVEKLEDFEGLQLTANPGVSSDGAIALGATPVVVPGTEMYTALERGMVDGTFMPFENVMALKLHEVATYHTMTNVNSGMYAVSMNLDTWNSLSPECQKAFDDLIPWVKQAMFDAALEADMGAIAACEAAGHTFIELSPEEMARWIEVSKPVGDAWAADLDSKGMPGTALLDEARQLIKAQ